MAVTNTFDSTSNNPLQLADLDENFTDLDTRITDLEAQIPAEVYRSLSGFEPDKLSTNVLNISPGSCANSDSTALFASSATLTVTMTTSGVGGLDTGSVANGTSYYIYLIANSTTGALAGLASAGETYGAVTLPTGYEHVRKLPFGFVYHAVNWDGIPDFHLSGWPRPFIRYTGAEEAAAWRALNAGTSGTFVDVDLSGWIPDNARMAYLLCRTATTGAGIGYGIIRVLGSQTAGLGVGGVVAGGAEAYSFIHQRVTSDRSLQYKVSGNASLTIFVLGYSMTEPS